MSNREESRATFDQASRKLPGVIAAGCLGGLLLGVIFATKLLALWAMAPGMIALGVVFLAVSRRRE